jgi:hypothetical protein
MRRSPPFKKKYLHANTCARWAAVRNGKTIPVAPPPPGTHRGDELKGRWRIARWVFVVVVVVRVDRPEMGRKEGRPEIGRFLISGFGGMERNEPSLYYTVLNAPTAKSFATAPWNFAPPPPVNDTGAAHLRIFARRVHHPNNLETNRWMTNGQLRSPHRTFAIIALEKAPLVSAGPGWNSRA